MGCRIRKIAIWFCSALAFTPAVALAACVEQGTTVVYVNGIFTDLTTAKSDLKKLREEYKRSTSNNNVTFINGYNPSHFAGLGDLVQAAAQIVGVPVSTYDRDTILLQIHPQVTTRRLLLVGHSQGALYTNELYDYLLTHGEPKEALGVYNIASPTYKVAGAGRYLNSANDSLLDFVEKTSGVPLLQRNITIPLAGASAKWPGHGLSDAYLAGASARIVKDVEESLSELTPAFASDAGECFTPPKGAFGYQAQKIFFGVADPISSGVKIAFATGYASTVAAVAGIADTVGKVVEDVRATVGGAYGLAHSAEGQYHDTNLEVVNRLYSGTAQRVDGESLSDLLGNSQGGAALLAILEEPPEPTVPEKPLTPTTETTDTSEAPVVPIGPAPGRSPGGGGGNATAVTVVAEANAADSTTASTTTSGTSATTTPTATLFSATTTAPVLAVEECSFSLSTSGCFVPVTTVHLTWSDVGAARYEVLVDGTLRETVQSTSTTLTLADQSTSLLRVVAYDASTTPSALSSNTQSTQVFERPIVVNEVAWAGTVASAADQWVELYNRTSQDLSLAPLALVARSSSAPLSKTISANQYFVAATNSGVIQGAAAAWTIYLSLDLPLLSLQPQQLALVYVTSLGTTTIDATPLADACGGSWCAGKESGQGSYAGSYGASPISMERLSTTTVGTEASNWVDNDGYARNANDSTGVEIVGSPGRVNSYHWPMAGFFCADGGVLTPGSVPAYMPSGSCTVLGGFVGKFGQLQATVYKGEVGTSTFVHSFSSQGAFGKKSNPEAVNFSSPNSGDQYFVILWDFDTSRDFAYSGDFDSWLRTGLWLDGIRTAEPPLTYKVIRFVIP